MSEKNNGILKHFIIIGSGTAINMFLGLITTPLITRIVDPNEYGQFSVFNMYSSIALMVLCLGLDQSLVRFFYEKKGTEYKRALLFRCVKLPVIVSIAVSIAFCSLVAMKVVNFEFDMVIAILLCVFTIFQILYRFSLLLVRLTYKSKMYSLLGILHKLIYIVVALPLILWVSKSYLLMLVIATIISAFVCLLVSIVVQIELWDISKNKDTACHISRRELYSFGLPYILSMGITTLFQALDKISLNYYCTYSDVGIYSSAMTLVNIFAIIQTTFNALWSPMATEHFTENKDDRTFYANGNRIITVVMFALGITLILCKDILAFLLGEKYRLAAYILPFLIFQPIMYTTSETTVMGINFMKKSKLHIIVALAACVTNAIGNTFFVPLFGPKGAAISTGISYIVFFTMRTLLANRYFPVNFDLIRFYLLTAIVSLFALYNTFIKFNIGTLIGYAICLLSLVLLYRETVIWCFKNIYDMLFGVLKKKSNE